MVSLSFTSVRSMANLFGRANNVSERRVTAVKSRGAWGANYEKLFFTHLILACLPARLTKPRTTKGRTFLVLKENLGNFNLDHCTCPPLLTQATIYRLSERFKVKLTRQTRKVMKGLKIHYNSVIEFAVIGSIEKSKFCFMI